MNQKLIGALSALVVVLAAGVVYFAFFNRPVVSPREPMVTDFNFIFKYGVGAINELNTFNQTYTKDMAMDPPITIQFKLTESERMGIYEKINSLHLFDEDGGRIGEGTVMVPCSSYYLKVNINSVQKELSWGCDRKTTDKLQQFTDYVISVIQAREEYKKLPAPKGGYM